MRFVSTLVILPDLMVGHAQELPCTEARPLFLSRGPEHMNSAATACAANGVNAQTLGRPSVGVKRYARL